MAVGNGGGDWNASRTSLRLAVGLQRESVMENSPSQSRPSSPLPSMQEVSARKTRVSYSGRRPSLSGANTQVAEKVQPPMTPSKLVKRKSLGFVRLAFGAGTTEEKPASAGKYPTLGLGLGRRAADSDDEEDYGDQQQQQRTRRKSFSKLLLDRDKSKDRDNHETPSKEGSRGFMGSVRRISLVGKHKRAQSGGGLGVVPSSPGLSGGMFFNRSGGGSKAVVPPPLPYSLPPLPASASQLSLRLPEASGSSYSLRQHQQPLNHPNLHLTSRRIVSASSGRSEASSVFPSSTISGGSGSATGSHSRSTGGGVQRTPSGKVRQRSKSRTRKSEDERREQQGGAASSSSTARRPSVTAKADRRSVDFVFNTEDTNHPQVLLPPIELQPPSPPRTLAQSAVEPPATAVATPKSKFKEPTSNGGKNNTRSLASALTAFDMHTLSPGTLSPTFSAVPSSPLSGSALAPPRTPQPTSPSTSSSSLFFTPTGSPYPPASPNKLAVGGTGHSPGKQSASLGRATAGGVVGVDGSSGVGVSASDAAGGNAGASASVPRRNSLGDLKIPARISQAQVGLRRDLGMVREFAMNIER